MNINDIRKDGKKLIEIITKIKKERKDQEVMELPILFTTVGVSLSPLIFVASMGLDYKVVPFILSSVLAATFFWLGHKKEKKSEKELAYFKNKELDIFFASYATSTKALKEIKSDINKLSDSTKNNFVNYMRSFVLFNWDLNNFEEKYIMYFVAEALRKEKFNNNDLYSLDLIKKYIEISNSVNYDSSESREFWISEYLKQLNFNDFEKEKNEIINLSMNELNNEYKEIIKKKIIETEEKLFKVHNEIKEKNKELSELKIKKENITIIKSI